MKSKDIWKNNMVSLTLCFDELGPVPVCVLQLVGKRYLLKAVRTLEKWKEKKIPSDRTYLGA